MPPPTAKRGEPPIFAGRSVASVIFGDYVGVLILSERDVANGITIVAIAKHKGRYLMEWVAYHLAIGVDRIVVYSNDTEDDQLQKLEEMARRDRRVETVDWPSAPTVSPQITGYNHALRSISTPWVGFIDVDEFIVPLEDNDIHQWPATIPADISSVHINWRGFGSGGGATDDYDLVTRTFELACPVKWGNHRPFKSIARSNLSKEAVVHNITLLGRRTLSDFREFETVHNGISNRICYHRIQINHYQCKTYKELEARMRRGSADLPPDNPWRGRDGSRERFLQLDLTAERNSAIRRFDNKVDAGLDRLKAQGPPSTDAALAAPAEGVGFRSHKLATVDDGLGVSTILALANRQSDLIRRRSVQ